MGRDAWHRGVHAKDAERAETCSCGSVCGGSGRDRVFQSKAMLVFGSCLVLAKSLVLAESLDNAQVLSTTAHAFFLAYTTYIGSVLPGLGDMSSAAGGSKPPAK